MIFSRRRRSAENNLVLKRSPTYGNPIRFLLGSPVASRSTFTIEYTPAIHTSMPGKRAST
jgi:hypothetical protein